MDKQRTEKDPTVCCFFFFFVKLFSNINTFTKKKKEKKKRYRDHLGDVLSDINVSFAANEKIGVVGRTGSGKSSLFLTLFRLLEPYQGHIEINKMNCNELSLFDLRSQLSIIPQDPVLFTETLRYNIDPLELHTDEEIMDVLDIVQMRDMVQKLLKDGLNTLMSEHGSNFSAGEAQLICVARALLHKSKILLVDEATSNVDPVTDMLIQSVLRQKFHNRTVLTIAHRLVLLTLSSHIFFICFCTNKKKKNGTENKYSNNVTHMYTFRAVSVLIKIRVHCLQQTILDSDRIMVLDKGKVVEFDTPHNLLNKTESDTDGPAIFRHMLRQLNAQTA
ncbi:ATP-binding cassette protein [Reticulomyxa filosa]|uniref:ATP-binding cassette protein n=1 Tax=Reticulomyxa filosa TaxID=46433 RepID=X6PF59_RETFI|nr:ATP-binding cassette protein [Reticulomyxa filosa]|eukprot:ETO36694.1 ATP-binding cassette protein [Reticulomyxa filosa]